MEAINKTESNTYFEQYRKLNEIAGANYDNYLEPLKQVFEQRKKLAQVILNGTLTEDNHKIAIYNIDYLNDTIKRVLSL